MSQKRDILIQRLKADPQLFRTKLRIKTPDGPKVLAESLDDWQAEDFEATDEAWKSAVGLPANPIKKRFYWERPRGHSKTTDIAVQVCWAIFAAKDKINGVAVAADKDQARLIRDAIDKLRRLNKWLRPYIKVDAYKVSNPRTGSELEVLSGDAGSSYGLLVEFAVVDELSHWGKRDMWDSIFSTAGKQETLILVISNAGWENEWQFEERNKLAKHPDWCFRRLDGPVASWITPKRLAEQRDILPPRVFARLWLNQWTAGGGDALEPDEIERAITLTEPPRLVREEGWIHIAGVDIGVKTDATAIVVISKNIGQSLPAPPLPRNFGIRSSLSDLLPEFRGSSDQDEYEIIEGTNRLRLTHVRVWQPTPGNEVPLNEVEQALLKLHEMIGLSAIAFDPSQARQMIQTLEGKGLNAYPANQTSRSVVEMTQATYDAFKLRLLDLYREPLLIADLQALRLKDKRGGARFESPRNSKGGTKHGDCATALQICLLEARKAWPVQQSFTNRPLIYN